MLYKYREQSSSARAGFGRWGAPIAFMGAVWALHSVTAFAAPLSHRDKAEVVTKLNAVLAANYVFPRKAQKIATVLERKLRNEAYRGITTKPAFARQLTEDLIAVTGDLHFVVGVDPAWVMRERAQKTDPKKKKAAELAALQEAQKANFGFGNVGVLEGNVGYIRFGYFADPEIGDETAAAAMRMVEHADALIFDLRYNNGGYLEMAQFLMSYLFAPGKERLLFDYYYNEDGQRTERGQWLLPALPGKRMPDTPVYLVTSCTSFSAAEWFAFVLKKLGRATVVGEVTAGAAHPVGRKVVDANFFVQTPIGVIRDPVDGKDFEGVGVKPHHRIEALKGVAYAHRLALKNLAADDEAKKAEYEWLAPVLAARLNPPKIPLSDLKRFVGAYEGRRLSLRDGMLHYHWRDRFRISLEPLTATLFAAEGISEFRFELVRDSGRVTALKRVERSGEHRVYKRIE